MFIRSDSSRRAIVSSSASSLRQSSRRSAESQTLRHRIVVGFAIHHWWGGWSGATGNDRAEVWPIARMFYQTLSPWIIQNVEAGFTERSTLAVFFAQNAVVRLFLQFEWEALFGTSGKFRSQMFAQELHGIALVAFNAMRRRKVVLATPQTPDPEDAEEPVPLEP